MDVGYGLDPHITFTERVDNIADGFMFCHIKCNDDLFDIIFLNDLFYVSNGSQVPGELLQLISPGRITVDKSDYSASQEMTLLNIVVYLNRPFIAADH